MKNSTLFRALALLLAMLMLFSAAVTVIGAEEPVDTENSEIPDDATEGNAGGSGNKVLRDDCWYIAYKNITTYSLVRSENAMNLVKAKVLELQQNFKKWTAADPDAVIDPETDHRLGANAGADLDLVTDASFLTNQEIVIGQVDKIGRPEMEERAKELNIGSADFFIEVREDGDVWIVGGSNTSTTVAIDYCLERVFDVNIAERYICVKKGFFYVYYNKPTEALPSTVIVDKGETGFEFTVSPGTMEDVVARLSFSKLGGWRIQNKHSVTRGFDDYGASQLLALSVGELPDLTRLPLTYETLEDGGTKVTAPDSSYAILYTEPFRLEFYTPSGAPAQTVTDLAYASVAGAKQVASMTFEIKENEPIYGGGQRFDNVNQYGQKLVLYSTDVWNNNESSDSNWQTQIVIPLFTNLRGSGIFVNRNEYMVADVGKTLATEMKIDVTSGLLDFYVFTTESIADSIGKYCEVSGANEMPEEWTYGMIVCRAYPDFSSLEKIYRVISKLEEYSLPWTGINVQGWSVYDDSTHEELKSLCEYVHALGKKVMVSVSVGDFPGASEMDAALREAEKKPVATPPAGGTEGGATEGATEGSTEGGATEEQPEELPEELPEEETGPLNYFMEYKTSTNKKHSYVDSYTGESLNDKKIPNCDPEMLYIGLLDSDKIKDNNMPEAKFYIDITDPEAMDWFLGEYWSYLIEDIGVDGVKLDEGFYLPDTAGSLTKIYDTSMQLAGMHHWYPTAFGMMLWDKIAAKPDSGVCFVRGAGIGAQRSSYVAVADQTRQFNRLQRQVTAMITAGLSGIAFTTFDIGGSEYKGGEMDIEDDAPVFLRSLEVAAFSVSMQVAGGVTRQPYDYAEYTDNKGEHPYAYVTELYKIYTMLHEALVPYLNEQGELACETGMPVIRHLVLQYANDVNVYDMKDQYMLGDAFLVAPVVPERIANNAKRKIYLPEGEWLDLLSGEKISVPAGGETLSKYNKKNALTEGQIPVFYNLNNTSEVAPEIYEEVQALLAMASAVEIP